MNTQPTWTIRSISSSQLKSKQDYQRKISMGFVEKTIAEFDPNKVEPVHVSYRDGKYYVMDGQHTILICEGVNGGNPVDMQCIVHKGMNYLSEAEWTVTQYEKTHKHNYGELTVAAFEAGRKLPCELALEVSRVGGRLPYDKKTTTGMRINAVKKVQTLFKKDASDTILAIKCLVEAYNGRESSLQGDIIAGTTEFLKLYGNNIVTSRLVNALAKYTPQTLTNTAKNLKMSYPINWTETLRDKYNEMSKRGKIKPIYSV